MNRFKFIVLAIALLFAMMPTHADITIEQCVDKARENYPLIRRYGILEALKDIDLADINKNWFPKIGVYGQLTGQNVVPSYPEMLTNMLEQMGQHVKGLSKIQYKVGVDINQTIWDGGASALNRKLVKSRDEVNLASLEVELYGIREKVENLYFAILLTEEQIAQNEVTAFLLNANLSKLRSMLKNGVAMQSDCDMVEAQVLSLRQNIDQAVYTREGLKRMLEIYIGESLQEVNLTMPDLIAFDGQESHRPELKLFEKQESLNFLSDDMTRISLLPKVGFFAQAYYGYPGFDYFKSMLKRTLSFNIMAGVKISWNLDALYTKKSNLRKTMLNAENIQSAKVVFMFNTHIASEQQRYVIEGLKKSMAEDNRIIELRTNVRKAAESQLENGVIDPTALLSKISDENIAILTSKLHQIQCLQEIYKLKYILNK